MSDSVVVPVDDPETSASGLTELDPENGQTYFPLDSIGLFFTVLAALAFMVLLYVAYTILRQAVINVVTTTADIVEGGAVTVADVAIKVGESIESIANYVVNQTSELIVAIGNAVVTVADALAAAIVIIAGSLITTFDPIVLGIADIAPQVLSAVNDVVNSVLDAIHAAMFGGDVSPFGFVPGLFGIFKPIFDLFG